MSKHGVLILSFLTFLGLAGTAFVTWWILANGTQAVRVYPDRALTAHSRALNFDSELTWLCSIHNTD